MRFTPKSVYVWNMKKIGDYAWPEQYSDSYKEIDVICDNQIIVTYQFYDVIIHGVTIIKCVRFQACRLEIG